jgi:hypothetical protein
MPPFCPSVQLSSQPNFPEANRMGRFGDRPGGADTAAPDTSTSGSMECPHG